MVTYLTYIALNRSFLNCKYVLLIMNCVTMMLYCIILESNKFNSVKFYIQKRFFPASLVHKRVQGGSPGGLGDHPPQRFERGNIANLSLSF